jgi:hypothetical protein
VGKLPFHAASTSTCETNLISKGSSASNLQQKQDYTKNDHWLAAFCSACHWNFFVQPVSSCDFVAFKRQATGFMFGQLSCLMVSPNLCGLMFCTPQQQTAEVTAFPQHIKCH